MRRVLAALFAAFVALALAGCNSGGGISLPTLPTTLPSVTIPTITLPTQTRTSPPATTTSEQQGTVTRTETETQTETRTQTATVTQTATPAPQPTGSASLGLPLWLWILIALLLIALIALIVWLVRRNQVRTAWDDTMTAARRESGWVEDSLVQQVSSKATTAEAAATWTAARPRLLALDESIYALSTTAPDPERAAAATRLRGRVTALVDAVSADTSLGETATVDDLRARRAGVAKARSELRALLEQQAAPTRR